MSDMVALKIANLNDHRFLPELEEKFRAVQETLCRYLDKHDDKAIGAKAVLTAKVTLLIEPTKIPSIRADIELKLPADPPHLSVASFGHDEHGPCCKVQKSGSFGDSPRQKRMFTDDGRKIDPDTGEILGEPSDPNDGDNLPGAGRNPPAA